MKHKLLVILTLCLTLTAFRPTANDSEKPTILLLGDSTLEGLARRFYDYAMENNFNLRSIIWYGSTSKQWANSKDLEYYINESQPIFIIVSLGTNEIGFNDYGVREDCVRKMVETIGDIPYVWLGPITWPRYKDRGMAAAIRRVVGDERYFDSTTVQLARQRDGLHPTYEAAARWVDIVVQWILKEVDIPGFELRMPTRKTTLSNYVSLRPSYKGRH